MEAVKNLKTGACDLQEAALTLAIAVIVERIRRLSKEDKEDLFELTKAIADAESQEEFESAAEAMREILDQSPAEVAPLTMDEPRNPTLRKWTDYVSTRIKEAREKAKITQEKLAELTGLPQSHISRLENGLHSPSHVTLEKIATALQLPLSQFDPSAE